MTRHPLWAYVRYVLFLVCFIGLIVAFAIFRTNLLMFSAHLFHSDDPEGWSGVIAYAVALALGVGAYHALRSLVEKVKESRRERLP